MISSTVNKPFSGIHPSLCRSPAPPLNARATLKFVSRKPQLETTTCALPPGSSERLLTFLGNASPSTIRDATQDAIQSYASTPNAVAAASSPESTTVIGTALTSSIILLVVSSVFAYVTFFTARRDAADVRVSLCSLSVFPFFANSKIED